MLKELQNTQFFIKNHLCAKELDVTNIVSIFIKVHGIITGVSDQ